MSDLSSIVAAGLMDNYQNFRQRVQTLAEPLSEEQFWIKPYAYGNSFGNLVLHLAGNLNYYIGAQIAQTGYVRNRELEFADRRVGEKEQTLKSLYEAVDTVIATLRNQTDEDWGRDYSAIGVDDIHDRFNIFVRCAAHFHHHVGQMIYLVKALTSTD